MMRCATALQSLASISAHALRQTLGQPLWRSRWRRLVVARCRTRLRLRRGLRRRQQGWNDFAHLRAVGFLRLLVFFLMDGGTPRDTLFPYTTLFRPRFRA